MKGETYITAKIKEAIALVDDANNEAYAYSKNSEANIKVSDITWKVSEALQLVLKEAYNQDYP